MVAKVYARFVPNQQERDRWEAAATALDGQNWGGRGVVGGVAGERPADASVTESPATPWEREASDDSRGGTRTHDPGIMSAVL